VNLNGNSVATTRIAVSFLRGSAITADAKFAILSSYV